MSRPRCCGRFCYWRLPFGPWCCTTCEKAWPGPMPASAECRFWEAIDHLVEKLRDPTPHERELLLLFRRRG